MPPLPTRAELALRYSAFERAERRREVIVSVLFMAALFGNLPLIRWLEPHGAEWIMLPVFVAEFAAAFAAVARAKRRAHAAGVSCPSCAAPFVRGEERHAVVATGNCVHCAAPVGQDAVETRGAVASEDTSQDTPARATNWSPLIRVAVFGLVAYWLTANGGRGQAGITPAAGVTVEQAAARIEASRGRPSVVLLYGTRCEPRCRVLAEFAAMARRHPDVEILAFSAEERGADELPALLWRHDANFAPVYLRRWRAGALGRAMAPLGIHIGTTWTPHLVAVLDADGRVVAQGQAVQDLAPFECALDGLRGNGVP